MLRRIVSIVRQMLKVLPILHCTISIYVNISVTVLWYYKYTMFYFIALKYLI